MSTTPRTADGAHPLIVRRSIRASYRAERATCTSKSTSVLLPSATCILNARPTRLILHPPCHGENLYHSPYVNALPMKCSLVVLGAFQCPLIDPYQSQSCVVGVAVSNTVDGGVPPIPVGARTIASSRRAIAMQFWLLSAIVGICAAYSTPAAPLGLQRSACVTPLSTINVQPARTSTVCVAEATCVHVVDQVSENDLMG